MKNIKQILAVCIAAMMIVASLPAAVFADAGTTETYEYHTDDIALGWYGSLLKGQDGDLDAEYGKGFSEEAIKIYKAVVAADKNLLLVENNADSLSWVEIPAEFYSFTGTKAYIESKAEMLANACEFAAQALQCDFRLPLMDFLHPATIVMSEPKNCSGGLWSVTLRFHATSDFGWELPEWEDRVLADADAVVDARKLINERTNAIISAAKKLPTYSEQVGYVLQWIIDNNTYNDMAYAVDLGHVEYSFYVGNEPTKEEKDDVDASSWYAHCIYSALKQKGEWNAKDEDGNPLDPVAARFEKYGNKYGDPYKPVCDGYAQATSYLLSELGVPVMYASGHTHAWNYVQMDDGLWYGVDTCWDGSPTYYGAMTWINGLDNSPSLSVRFLDPDHGHSSEGIHFVKDSINEFFYDTYVKNPSPELESPYRFATYRYDYKNYSHQFKDIELEYNTDIVENTEDDNDHPIATITLYGEVLEEGPDYTLEWPAKEAVGFYRAPNIHGGTERFVGKRYIGGVIPQYIVVDFIREIKGSGTEADPWLMGPSGPDGCSNAITGYVDGNTLKISGTGEMGDWSGETNAFLLLSDDWEALRTAHPEITTVEVGEGITKVMNLGFPNASKFVLPSTLTEIGGGTFAGSKIKTVAAGTVSDPMLTTGLAQGALGSVEPAGSTDADVVIPYGVTTIGDQAFAYCTLTSVVFPESVKEFGSKTFLKSAIDYVEFPADLPSMGWGAFDQASKIGEIVFPENLEKIEGFTFYFVGKSADAFKSLVIPDTVKEIGTSAFACSVLQELTLPAGLETMEDDALLSTSMLKTIALDNAATAKSGFKVIDNVLFKVDAQGNPTQLYYYPSARDTSADSGVYTVPEGVKSIRKDAFFGVTLEKLVLPAGLEELNLDDYCIIGTLTIPTSLGEGGSGVNGRLTNNISDFGTKVDYIAFDGTSQEWYALVQKNVPYFSNVLKWVPDNHITCAGEPFVPCNHPESAIEYSGVRDAGCYYGGYSGYPTCTICGAYVESHAPHSTPALGHIFCEDEWCYTAKYHYRGCLKVDCEGFNDVTKESFKDVGEHDFEYKRLSPTETVYTCKVCGYEKHFVNSKLVSTEKKRPDDTKLLSNCPHANLETVGAVEMTCVQDGYTGDVVCKDCGLTRERGEVNSCDGHHTWELSFDDNYHFEYCTVCYADRDVLEIRNKEPHTMSWKHSDSGLIHTLSCDHPGCLGNLQMNLETISIDGTLIQTVETPTSGGSIGNVVTTLSITRSSIVPGYLADDAVYNKVILFAEEINAVKNVFDGNVADDGLMINLGAERVTYDEKALNAIAEAVSNAAFYAGKDINDVNPELTLNKIDENNANLMNYYCSSDEQLGELQKAAEDPNSNLFKINLDVDGNPVEDLVGGEITVQIPEYKLKIEGGSIWDTVAKYANRIEADGSRTPLPFDIIINSADTTGNSDYLVWKSTGHSFYEITTVAPYGDVDDELGINASDVTSILKQLVGQGSLKADARADLNGDGTVDSLDALILLKHIAKRPGYTILSPELFQ